MKPDPGSDAEDEDLLSQGKVSSLPPSPFLHTLQYKR